MNTLKDRLKAGEALHGCWLNSGGSLDAEIVGKSGFDWVTIDLEHGVGTENNLLYQLQALNGTPTFPIVRVEALIQPRVSRVLDLGARGILFPMIRNPQQAQEAASFLRYPPDGIRGMATMTRATDFGRNLDGYHKTHKEHILGVIQIETSESLDHLEEIASIDGVDVLFVGPADLTLSMGIFKQFDHPRYIEALKKVQQAAQKAGKATGTLMPHPGEYEKYYELGYRMLGCGSDSFFVIQGARDMVKALNDCKFKHTP